MIICGLPLSRSFRHVQRIEKLLHVLAVDFLDIEAVGLEAFAGVFALGCLRHRVERDGIRIVDQDQIIEAEVTGERARFRGDAFLQTAVAAPDRSRADRKSCARRC